MSVNLVASQSGDDCDLQMCEAYWIRTSDLYPVKVAL